jgi:hypothetical protein
VEYSSPHRTLPIVRIKANDGKTVKLTRQRDIGKLTVAKGPVQRLVTHARGRAYSFLAAVACQLGIIIALLFAK